MKTEITMNQIVHDVNKQIGELTVIAENHFGKKLVAPDVLYNLKGLAAGKAYGGKRIRFNLKLLIDNYADFIKVIVPHEFAHIVDCQVNGKSSIHGKPWKEIMRLFNLPAKRCHNYDVKHVRRPRTIKVVEVSCCKTHKLSLTKVRRLIKRPNAWCKCKNCGKAFFGVDLIGKPVQTIIR